MNLLLLTKFYPYGTGEAFIENEVQILSEYYDKIVIIACEVTKKDTLIRPLPPNVTVYKVPAGSKKNDAIFGLLNIFSKDEAVSSEMIHAGGLLQKLFLCYFERKSRRIYRYIIEHHYVDEFCKEPFVLYSYWLFMTARVGTLLAEANKPVYMFTRGHRYDLYEERNHTKYLPYRELFLNQYDHVFPCSVNGAKYLKSKYPDLSQHVMTAFLGTLDYGMGNGSSDGVFRIVSCSRVEPVKRVGMIVEALQEIDQENLKIEWTHIGDGSELEQIKKSANDKLHHVKCIFKGNMKNSDIMKLYRENPYDLLINVSSSEGLPVSIMEAISFGIPVVGTDVGGTSEIVIDGVTGKLINPKFTPRELAKVILDFAGTEKMTVSRDSCRTFWSEHFQAVPNYRRLCEFVKVQYEKKIQSMGSSK